MKKQNERPPADAWAVILERGYSESFIATVEKDESLKSLRSALRKWLASDVELGIIAMPMQQGDINIRTLYISSREDLSEAIGQVASYLGDYIGGGKRVAFSTGGTLSAETQKIMRETLGELPGPWAFN